MTTGSSTTGGVTTTGSSTTGGVTTTGSSITGVVGVVGGASSRASVIESLLDPELLSQAARTKVVNPKNVVREMVLKFIFWSGRGCVEGLFYDSQRIFAFLVLADNRSSPQNCECLQSSA